MKLEDVGELLLNCLSPLVHYWEGAEMATLGQAWAESNRTQPHQDALRHDNMLSVALLEAMVLVSVVMEHQ